MADPVILTGATGFVGRAVLAALLAGGHTVHAVARRAGPARAGVTWHAVDLLTARGQQAVAGLAPTLVHCAWDVAHGVFWTAPDNRRWHQGGRDLVARFLDRGGRRVLVTGTCAEYAATAQQPVSERAQLAPDTLYGQAKADLFTDLTALCADRLIWARLFHLFGAGEDPRRLVPSLIAAFQAGARPEVRAAGLLRDYASSGYVARCLVALLDNPAARGPVNIGSGAPRSLGDLAGIIAACVGAGAGPVLGDADGGQPPVLVPDLHKLQGLTGLPPEDTAAAIKALVRNMARKQR